jgi:hypothetical protein
MATCSSLVVTPALASAAAQSPLAHRLDRASAAKHRAFFKSSLCSGTTAAAVAAAVPELMLVLLVLVVADGDGVSEESSAASAAMTGLLESAAPLVSVPSASAALCGVVV